MATCHGQGGEQDWAHTKEGKIIHKVKMFTLWPGQKKTDFGQENNLLQETKKCLDAGRGQSMDLLYVAPCQNIPSQVEYSWSSYQSLFVFSRCGTLTTISTNSTITCLEAHCPHLPSSTMWYSQEAALSAPRVANQLLVVGDISETWLYEFMRGLQRLLFTQLMWYSC